MNTKQHLLNLVRWVWRAMPGGFHWRILWYTHAKFNIGVGILVIFEDSVLLVKNRVRTSDYWSLPTGWINSGEELNAAASREINEEVGINQHPSKFTIVGINSGYKLRLEVFLKTSLAERKPLNLGAEIVEASFFKIKDLPSDLPHEHCRRIIEEFDLPVS